MISLKSGWPPIFGLFGLSELPSSGGPKPKGVIGACLSVNYLISYLSSAYALSLTAGRVSVFPAKFNKLTDMSAAAAALIWWIVPAVGLIGALGYAVWVSKFKTKYDNDTLRSTDAFEKFQNAFRK